MNKNISFFLMIGIIMFASISIQGKHSIHEIISSKIVLKQGIREFGIASSDKKIGEISIKTQTDNQGKVNVKLPSFGFDRKTTKFPKNSGKGTNNVKIASLSYIPVKWDKQANLFTIEKMARKAAAAGAQILITPEGGLEGYLIDELRKSKEREKWEPKFQEIAEPINGPGVMQVRALAHELGVDLVLGFLERDGEILYNSCVWINPQGEVMHVHRKTHMAQPYFDPENYHPGFELKAFDTQYGRVGMMICFERQIPEVASALAVDGARILINPSYGSRGEWNTTMLRVRAKDNGAYIVFTHPKQTLIIAPDGNVIVDKDNENGAGIVYGELDLKKVVNPPSKLTKRRPEVFADKLAESVDLGNQRMSRPGHIKVATVQMQSTHVLKENVERICRYLGECAKKGVRVALFPECVTTGYFKNDIPKYSKQDYLDAQKAIAFACEKYKIYAIVGTPYYENNQLYNMALVIDAQGQTIYHQAKIHLVGSDRPWAVPGNRLDIFPVDGNSCSIMICHDSRYPELVRLPAMKGSRLVFYLSSESTIQAEHKIDPYRAQVVARAVENNVYIVHANTPQSLNPLEGSHGQSRIISSNGTLIQEASIMGEDILIQVLDLTLAGKKTVMDKKGEGFLEDWWETGLKQIGGIEEH